MGLDPSQQAGPDPGHRIELGQRGEPAVGTPMLDDRLGHRHPYFRKPGKVFGAGSIEIDPVGPAERAGQLRDPGSLLGQGRRRDLGQEGELASRLGGVEGEEPDPVPDQGTDQERTDGKTFVGCHRPKLRPGPADPITKLPRDQAL